jgi:hypothetical protein
MAPLIFMRDSYSLMENKPFKLIVYDRAQYEKYKAAYPSLEIVLVDKPDRKTNGKS